MSPCCFRVILGRTHVKSVAEERKLELELCLKDLLILSPEISEVYPHTQCKHYDKSLSKRSSHLYMFLILHRISRKYIEMVMYFLHSLDTMDKTALGENIPPPSPNTSNIE